MLWGRVTRWYWAVRMWWAFPRRVREAYGDGYRMGWHERGVGGMRLNEDAALNEWMSRLGE